MRKIREAFPTRGEVGREKFNKFKRDGKKFFTKLELDIINLIVYSMNNETNITSAQFHQACDGEKVPVNLHAGNFITSDNHYEFTSRNKATPKQWLRALLNLDKRNTIQFNGKTYVIRKGIQLSPSED